MIKAIGPTNSTEFEAIIIVQMGEKYFLLFPSIILIFINVIGYFGLLLLSHY